MTVEAFTLSNSMKLRRTGQETRNTYKASKKTLKCKEAEPRRAWQGTLEAEWP